MERDDLCGRTLGEFVLRERIGEGGFGAVYRCQQPLLGRQAVVKVLHRRLRDSEIELQRFTREAQLASRLDHPYAAHVYAFGVEQEDGLFWIAMEMVQGTTLDRWLRDRGPLPVDQLVPFFERVAEVVETAHERGIIHRDLKPSNVMVIERAGRLLPKLLDFGIAKMLISEPHVPVAPKLPAVVGDAVTPRQLDIDTMPLGASDSAADAIHVPLTRADAAMGSPPYMSPEQWRDALAVTPRSDLYSLAIVAYESLTGRRPFVATTGAAYADLHANAAVPPLGAGFSTTLDRFFARALAKRPEDRPASALELAAELRIAAGLGTTVVDLPKIDDDVRTTWLADAPQPLAEAVAAVEGARNAHQARDAVLDLVRGLVRYVLAVALAARAQVRDDRDSPALLEMLRAARRHELDDDARIKLIRLLARPFTSRRGAHPVPELVDLVTPDDGNDAFDPILDARPTGGSEDVVRSQLAQLVPLVTRLLRACTFVLDYVLAVPREGLAERWTGLRRPRRVIATVKRGELVDGHPVLLDRDGRAVVELWPLVQTVAPAAGAELELFVFDGPGRHGARLVAAGFQHHDATVWDWFGSEVIGDDDAESAASDERPPYLGLASFSSSDADRFVGRERETDACVNRLRRQALLVVVGASGAGKSSFVHAGLVPALPAGWRVVTMRPGATPMTTLAARLVAANVTSTDVHAVLDAAPAAAAALVAHAAAAGTITIVVDQLEEMFTLCADAGERLRFATALSHLAASAETPVRVVATIRDDFLMQLEALAPLRALISPALMLLGNPSRDDLIRTVIEPAARLGYEPSDPELVADMVDEVAERPGALSLLSFTASRLWELRDRRFHQLTRNAYDAMGRVGGALGRHAEDVLATLSADERRLAPDVFRNLVTADRTRAVLGLAELRERLSSPRADEVIDKLVAARLLEVAELDGKPSIEIIHEALIAAWPRLQRWVASDAEAARMREQLSTTAKQWHERGRPRGLLWRDDVLVELERWRRRGAVALSDVEMAFADASRAAATRGRRIRRSIVATIFVVLAATAVVMIYLRAQATEQGDLATERLAQSYEERGQQALLASDTDAALAYLAEALEVGDDTPAVRFMIARALAPLSAEVATLRGHDGEIWSISYDPNGTRLLTAGNDGTVRVWDARDGAPVAVLGGHAHGAAAAAWSPDGTHIATGDTAGQLRLWTRDGQLDNTSSRSTAELTAIVFAPDARHVATASIGDGYVTIWNATTGSVVSAWKASDSTINIAFDRVGSRVATCSTSGDVSLWSLDGHRLAHLEGHEGPVWFARFDPDGKRIATAGLDGTARIWDPATGKSLALGGHKGRVTHVAWSPSGQFVATTGVDRTAQIWNAATGVSIAVLRGHTAQVNYVEFTRDGSQVVTAAADGTARIWDARTGLQTAVFAHAGFIYDAAIEPSGSRLATATWGGTAKIWDLSRQPHIATLMAPTKSHAVARVAGERVLLIVDDGARLWDQLDRAPRRYDIDSTMVAGDMAIEDPRFALGDVDGNVHVYDPERETATSAKIHAAAVLALAMARDGSRFASWGADGMIVLADVRGHSIARVNVPVDATPGTNGGLILAFSEQGDRLLALSPGPKGTVILDGHSLHEVARLNVDAAVAVFGSGGRIATGGNDHIVRIWTRDGVLEMELPAMRSAIGAIAWSPSASHLVVGGWDGFIEIWDSRSWRLIGERKAHTNIVGRFAFTRDGKVVASAGGDQAVKLWDVETAKEVGAVPSDNEVVWLHIDRHDRLFVLSDFTNSLTVWNVVGSYLGTATELVHTVRCHTTNAIVDGLLVTNQVRPPCG